MVWFSEVDLRVAAGPKAFTRGRKIVDAVSEVHTTADGVRAVVHGSSAYAVFLGPASPGLIGECDCPVDGFCKHCVAVGLVLLAGPVADDLRSLAASPYPQVTALRRRLEAALTVRGSVDPAGSVEYAAIADDVLDTVESLITGGHAAEARPLARRAVDRITESLLLIDDVSGVAGAACQRALTLYARACAAARPNAAKLAEWLFRLQLHSPGWPTVKLSDFAGALGDAGMSAYRTLLADAWENRSAAEGDIRPALTLLLMRERLAKLDGDPGALEIAERLPNPALFLSVSGSASTEWLVEFLVQAYLDCGRHQDALELRRSQLSAQPTRAGYTRLRATAETLDRWPDIQPWALDVVRAAAARHNSGDELVATLLDDGDIAEAWYAADKHDCSPALWLQAARLRAVSHPADVLPGYRLLIEAAAARTGRRHYREAAALLGELHAAAQASNTLAEHGAFVAALRTHHHRKPALLDELDRG